MSQPPKSPSRRQPRRRIDLDTEADVEIYSRATRDGLIQQLREKETLLANTVGEMRVQENRMNECVRIVSDAYALIYGMVAEYAAAVWWNERVSGANNPLPPAWFAGRVQKFSEELFEKYDLKGLAMRPPAHMVAGNLFISKKQMNPGSKLHEALCVQGSQEINTALIRAAFIELMKSAPLPDTHRDEFLSEVVEHVDAKKEG